MIRHTPVTNGAARSEPGAALNPDALAEDLGEVCRLYSRLFESIDTTRWDDPSERGPNEWTLHETIAHLCALDGAGVKSIAHTLRSETYTFDGLQSRYQLDAYNRRGIDERLSMSPDQLFDDFIHVHNHAVDIARGLRPGQEALTSVMPIYNRPVQIAEALGIITMHAGLIHTAQVAEPARMAPLWTQLSPALRHRQIERVMRAFGLLYRRDIGGSLRATFAFRVDGPGGGDWFVSVSPDQTLSAEGVADSPSLLLRFGETDDFCRMMTLRLNLGRALATRKLRLRGHPLLFLRMNKLFSVDARP